MIFYSSDVARESDSLATLLRDGFPGVEVVRFEEYAGPRSDAIVWGIVKAKTILPEHVEAGYRVIYLDKGYTRNHIRAAINDTDPTRYFEVGRPPDRAMEQDWRLQPRQNGRFVMFCGSSQKYCDYHGLGDATAYAGNVIQRISALTSMPVVYRPKPSWNSAVPVTGSAFDPGTQPLAEALKGCHCIVTHGSGAAVQAVVAGVPVVTLGNGVCKSLSGSIEDIRDPFWPSDERRQQFVNDISYCQFTMREIADGTAWKVLKP